MLRIGELADQVGVATSAVRFYETKGLLAPDDRVAGQRRYTDATVERLRMIVLLRGAGLSCDDIAVALDPTPEGARRRRERAGRRADERGGAARGAAGRAARPCRPRRQRPARGVLAAALGR